MTYDLAQVNIARLDAPLDDPRLADFIAALDSVNADADAAPGFVWRLQTEDGNATAIRAFEWDAAGSAGMIVNMSTWTSVQALADYVFSGRHLDVMKRRREWFVPMREAYAALWWVPAGHRPSTAEAEDRVRHLRQHGPTEHAFTIRRAWPEPGATATSLPVNGRDDWLCPA